MKNGNLKMGILSMAGGLFLTILMGACNNDDSSKSGTVKEEVSADTTAKVTVAPKKKGKVSMSITTTDANGLKIEKDKMGVYTRAEVMPVYPGNDQALSDYIASKIVYPDQAVENNAEGTVRVQFVVDEHGAISDVQTVGNKIGYGLEEEAVNVVSKLPNWTPGKVKGKNVKTRLSVPITYKLES
ncbi:MAG: energy transducer TonB [Chitinophagaceae bacterium]|nr:energy transducer TonB [Chitinophagaceae bacterium]